MSSDINHSLSVVIVHRTVYLMKYLDYNKVFIQVECLSGTRMIGRELNRTRQLQILDREPTFCTFRHKRGTISVYKLSQICSL